MKGIIGFIIIFLSFFGISKSFYSSPDLSSKTYLFTIIICFICAILVNKPKGTNIVISWILMSIIPSLGVIMLARFGSHSSGGSFFSTDWDWGVWELFIPFCVIIVQLILIIYILSNRYTFKKKN